MDLFCDTTYACVAALEEEEDGSRGARVGMELGVGSLCGHCTSKKVVQVYVNVQPLFFCTCSFSV